MRTRSSLRILFESSPGYNFHRGKDPKADAIRTTTAATSATMRANRSNSAKDHAAALDAHTKAHAVHKDLMSKANSDHDYAVHKAEMDRHESAMKHHKTEHDRAKKEDSLRSQLDKAKVALAKSKK